jgi:serine/threonine-protein kinase RsbW
MPERSLLAELKVPAQVSFIPVAKMVAASLGSQVGFNLEEIDELKIAVAQACDSTIEEAQQLWGEGDGAMLKLAYRSTGRGIVVDVEAVAPQAAARRPAGVPASLPSPAGPRAEQRALQRDMIRLFVDDFRHQVDSGRGHIRFRMVKYLIS